MQLRKAFNYEICRIYGRGSFYKKTVKGYPKSKENLTPVKNEYYVYGQNIKHQYNFKILMNDIYLYKIELGHPILAYTSSVGEIGLIEESFYRSGDNGAFQALIPKDNQISKYELQYILSILKSILIHMVMLPVWLI